MDSVLLLSLLLYLPLILVLIMLATPLFLQLQPVKQPKWQILFVLVPVLVTILLHTFRYDTDYFVQLASTAVVGEETRYLSVLDVVADPILPAEIRLMAYEVLFVSVILTSTALFSGIGVLRDEYLYLSLLGTALHCLDYLGMIMIIDHFSAQVRTGIITIHINPLAKLVLELVAALPLVVLVMLLRAEKRSEENGVEGELYPQQLTP